MFFPFIINPSSFFLLIQIQLSQNPDGITVQERVITIKGEKHQLISASNIIVDKIKDDPQSASCPNISYSGIVGPVANANPTGSPYAAGSHVADPTAAAAATILGNFIIAGTNQVVQAAVPAGHHFTPQPQSIAGLPALNAASLSRYQIGGYAGAPQLIPSMHPFHPALPAALPFPPYAETLPPLPRGIA